MKKIYKIVLLSIISLLISTNVYANSKWNGTCVCYTGQNKISFSCASRQQSCSEICKSVNGQISTDNCSLETTNNNSKTAVTGETIDCGEFSEITRPAAKIIIIAAPIILLVLGTVDFLKAVAASDEKEMKKAISTFLKRTIICVIIILLPIIVNMIISWTAFGDLTSCGITNH